MHVIIQRGRRMDLYKLYLVMSLLRKQSRQVGTGAPVSDVGSPGFPLGGGNDIGAYCYISLTISLPKAGPMMRCMSIMRGAGNLAARSRLYSSRVLFW